MKRVLVALALAACGHAGKRPTLAAPDTASPALPRLVDVMVPKRTAPGGDVLGQTTCGSVMVMHERRGGSTRVTLERSEESFWVDDKDLDAAPHAYHRCMGPLMLRDARVSDQLAHSLTPAVLAEADAWESFEPELPKSIYQRDDKDTSCVELQLGGGKLAASSIEWGFEREGTRDLRLTGPTIMNVKEGATPFELIPSPGDHVGYLCLKELFMARRTKSSWELVRKTYDATKMDVWAYSPASSERWYATRPACEKGLARGAGLVAKIPFTGCM